MRFTTISTTRIKRSIPPYSLCGRLHSFGAVAIFQILVSSALGVQADQRCWKSPVDNSMVCETLAVDKGKVSVVEPGRTIPIGTYVGAAQRFVSPKEAPIRDVRSPGGWHI